MFEHNHYDKIENNKMFTEMQNQVMKIELKLF